MRGTTISWRPLHAEEMRQKQWERLPTKDRCRDFVVAVRSGGRSCHLPCTSLFAHSSHDLTQSIKAPLTLSCASAERRFPRFPRCGRAGALRLRQRCRRRSPLLRRPCLFSLHMSESDALVHRVAVLVSRALNQPTTNRSLARRVIDSGARRIFFVYTKKK